MSRRAPRAGAVAAHAAPLLAALRTELAVPETYDAAALAEAEEAASRPVADDHERVDLRHVPFVTLDPPGARDLDQAFHLEPDGDGFLLQYAIADVASYVTPGGALDAETRRRGLTFYGPDRRFGLHPPVLSEDAASLLPDVDRRAAVWQLRFDPDGVLVETLVRRAIVRSREQLDYAQVQQVIDDGSAEPVLALLPRLGALRLDLQISRGGATIDVPEQEVEIVGEGEDTRYRLVFRAPLAVEEHNAQLSLATGIAAAALQREAGVGVWRTLAPAHEADVNRLRKVARALGLEWPRGTPYGAFARTVDVTTPAAAAFATEATRLFRGAGYVAFGTPSSPAVPFGAVHSAIAAEYAHVTAPLRRLVDRYGTEIALARCAGTPVPQWVVEALDALPTEMAEASHRANAYERQSVDLLEALIMTPRVGRTYDAVVVESTHPKEAGAPARGTVLVSSPALRLRVAGPREVLRPGARVRIVITGADVVAREISAELA